MTEAFENGLGPPPAELPGAFDGGSFGPAAIPPGPSPLDSYERPSMMVGAGASERDALLAAGRLDAVIEGARDAIVRLSTELTIQSWNRAAQAMFEFTDDVVLEGLVDVVVPASSRGPFEAWLSAAAREGVTAVRFETELVTRSGTAFPAECSVAERHAIDDDVTVFVRDLSIPKRLELEQRQAQKLGAVARLAGGMAHEVNTPLQYLADNLSFLESALGTVLAFTTRACDALARATTVAEAREEIERLQESAELGYYSKTVPEAVESSRAGLGHIARIVGAMKALTRAGSLDDPCVDLREIVETSATIAMAGWQSVATLDVSFEERLPPVACVPGEIGQVVMALVTNAAEAIGRKRTAESAGGGGGRVRLSMHCEAAEIVLRVADDGCGVRPEHASLLFEPFFTTKDVGEGMGQGLAVAHTVVERHRGRIEWQSELGEGTTFEVRLPLTR